MSTEKKYFCEIKINSKLILEIDYFGENKKQFIRNVKDNIYHDHNIKLTDGEIWNIKER